MIPASKIGLEINHALLANLPKLTPNPNHPKSPIYLMKGDPTEFGLEDCRMIEEGYQIVRDSIMKDSNHSYTVTHGSPGAREAVVKYFGSQTYLTPDDVVITSGVNFGLYYIFIASCEPGQNILVPECGYPFYDMIAPSFGVGVRKYKLKQNQNWEIDLESLDQLLDQNTKFLFVINPSSPLGSVFSKQHVKDIVQWAQNNFTMIVADEVYYGQSFGEFTSFGQEAQEGPIVCLSGLEKIYFVPGWCTAWMIFYDKNGYAKEIREAVGNACQLFLHTNTFLMASLGGLFEKLGVDFVKRSNPAIRANHDRLVQGLQNVPGLKPSPAQGTFYLTILLDLEILKFNSDVEFITKLLEEENMQAFPISAAGTQKYQGLRLLTCIKPQMVDQILERLEGFCLRHRK